MRHGGRVDFARSTVIVAFASLLVSGSVLLGQTQNADIVGTIREAQGNVIPDATVRVINEDTQAMRVVTSDASGDYLALGLFLGTYTVEAEKAGFKTSVVKGIRVDPQVRKRVDVTLEVGKVTTTIEVAAKVGGVQTESSSISQTVQHDLIEKPFVQNGRAGWAYDEAMWMPGSSAGNGTSNIYGGVGGSQIENQAEGAQAYLQIISGPQAVQELNTVMGTPSAEYARPVEQNIIFRGGSNALHASYTQGYYNPAVEAVNTVAGVQKRPTGIGTWRDEVNVGGPVYIPKVYDGRNKTFFFFDYWRTKIGASGVTPVSIPSLRMLSGDFSKDVNSSGALIPVIDPQTGQQFPGNVIPPNRISNTAKAIENTMFVDDFGAPIVYGPNPDASVNNAFAPYKQTRPFWNYLIKVDQTFGTKHVLEVTWDRDIETTWQNYFVPSNGPANGRPFHAGDWAHEVNPQVESSIHYTYTPTAHVVNELRFAWNRYHDQQDFTPNGTNPSPILGAAELANWGILGVTPSNLAGIPGISITNWLSATGLNAYNNIESYWMGFENLTYVRGRHSFKGGFAYTKTMYDLLYNPGFGSFGFDGRFTSEPLADFLLGLPGSFSETRGVRPTEAERIAETGFYVQDQWRVTPRLDLSYGVRWDHYSAPYDKNGQYYNFDPAANAVVVPNQFALNHINALWPTATLPVVLASSVGYPSKLTNPDSRWLPRLACAYRPTGKSDLVVRAGAGFYNSVFQFGGLQLTGPFSVTSSYTNSLATQYAFPNPFLNVPALASGVATGASVSTNFRPDYIAVWNLSVEKSLFPQWNMRISYMGNKDTNLAYSRNIDSPVLGTVPFAQAPRPYPQYMSITRIENGADEHYNSVDFVLQHPFHNGMLLQVSYMLQRGYEDTGSGDQGNYGVRGGQSEGTINYAYNRARDYARNMYWPSQDFIINHDYELPFGPGKRFLANTNGEPGKWVLARIVGGWDMVGVFNWHSGVFFTPTFTGYDSGNLNQFSGRPNVVPGCKMYTGTKGSSQPWFNVNCFTAPAPGTLGNAAINSLTGPSGWVWSLSPYKVFHIPHWEKGTLRVGAQIYNVLNNSAYLSNPSGNIGSYTLQANGATTFSPNLSGTYPTIAWIRRDSEHFGQRQFDFQASIQF